MRATISAVIACATTRPCPSSHGAARFVGEMGVEPFVPFRRLLLVIACWFLRSAVPTRRTIWRSRSRSNLSGSNPPASLPKFGRRLRRFLLACVGANKRRIRRPGQTRCRCVSTLSERGETPGRSSGPRDSRPAANTTRPIARWASGTYCLSFGIVFGDALERRFGLHQRRVKILRRRPNLDSARRRPNPSAHRAETVASAALPPPAPRCKNAAATIAARPRQPTSPPADHHRLRLHHRAQAARGLRRRADRHRAGRPRSAPRPARPANRRRSLPGPSVRKSRSNSRASA